MNSSNNSNNSATSEELTWIAVDLCIAVSKSMSSDNIDPMHWWQRLKSALVQGASAAQNFKEMASIMARKLQIKVYSENSITWIRAIELKLVDYSFNEFKTFCRKNAEYIVPMAQITKQEHREKLAAQKGEVY